MTVQQINSNISDDSDDMVSLPSENEIYRRKYQMLLERCEVLQQDNERIVNRIHEAKKITKRYRKDIKLLVDRLDKHCDQFRTAATELDTKSETIGRPTKPATVKSNATLKQSEKQIVTLTRKPGPKRKAKSEKPEKDPNAPKKPCNAFFQFCQEQRPLVVAETSSEMGGNEPTKQEVTRQLASRWRALSEEDKRVYVAMFKRSKEKYAEEMSAYIKKEQ
ncbi:High mobility group-T protein [Eumeta japonica]|uniref:High mobility group-T protein n=1 Tax=Eumeta variegata TaxID=151549 RepID=A0A4C1YBE7_EUMVA|nr:High mobility group-T protein [Eumeta japonica]